VPWAWSRPQFRRAQAPAWRTWMARWPGPISSSLKSALKPPARHAGRRGRQHPRPDRRGESGGQRTERLDPRSARLRTSHIGIRVRAPRRDDRPRAPARLVRVLVMSLKISVRRSSSSMSTASIASVSMYGVPAHRAFSDRCPPTGRIRQSDFGKAAGGPSRTNTCQSAAMRRILCPARYSAAISWPVHRVEAIHSIAAITSQMYLAPSHVLMHVSAVARLGVKRCRSTSVQGFLIRAPCRPRSRPPKVADHSSRSSRHGQR